jgi:hypothetical protein
MDQGFHTLPSIVNPGYGGIREKREEPCNLVSPQIKLLTLLQDTNSKIGSSVAAADYNCRLQLQGGVQATVVRDLV